MDDTLISALLLAAIAQLFWIMNKIGKVEQVIDILLNECSIFDRTKCETRNDVSNPKRKRQLPVISAFRKS